MPFPGQTRRSPNLSNHYPGRVLVTGAAAGIGLAISRKIRSLGTTVVMCDKDVLGLDAAVLSLSGNGQEAIAVYGDITDTATIARVAEAAGPLDGLVNCAGIYPVTGLLDLSVDEWDRVLSLNLRTPFLLTQAVTRRMIAEKRGGSIVNISSTASSFARPGISHYGASKAGLNQLTRIMAVELAQHGIRVNAILPGVIETETVKATLTTPAVVAEMTAKQARIPMARLGMPEEIAELAAFLLSPASSYSTGGLFTADGGFSLGIARY
jgi:NAD(P)-dependent dehydrogenase (short-subunit alcohol dehydrogenase family)